MKEYGSSQLLKNLMQQENIANIDPPKKFEVNVSYKQTSPKPLNKSIQISIPDPIPDPIPYQISNQISNQIPDPISLSSASSFDLPSIPPPIDPEEQHMRPVILGEMQEEDQKEEKTFLQALRQGNCILQLPNKLPFHEMGKVQKQVEEVLGDQVQKQLKDYYDECYDSSGILLQKQYTNLSNKENVGIHLGKIIIASDGKALWKAGREEFEIVQGVIQNIDQKCLVINKEDANCDFINVGDKFVISHNY
ncbi:unnamed protein product [Paramecium sonneborni]|uniref:Uncharacterized protein n=1 Tax=Paramecium sonneborni TaxID=65129 RepID=A0A8S1NA77_9CILI|nr:unnamed protein product [Paramecium sonneborni]